MGETSKLTSGEIAEGRETVGEHTSNHSVVEEPQFVFREASSSEYLEEKHSLRRFGYNVVYVGGPTEVGRYCDA